MSEWFYVQNGKQAGPVETGRLVQMLGFGEVRRNDLVWRDGMSNWLEAGEVDELRPPAPISNVSAPGFAGSYPVQPLVAAAPVTQYYSQQSQADVALAQSGLGLASFVIAVIGVLFEGAAIVAAVSASTQKAAFSGGVAAKATPAAGMVAAGLAMFAGVFLCMISAGLGVASLYQRRRRLFGVLGLVISGSLILIFVALMVIGLLAK